jgi:hypothetical protein
MATTPARRSTSTRAKAAAKAAEEVIEAPEEEEVPKDETISQKRNRLRNKAERIIIDRYRDEFNKVATDLFAENGLVFHKRLTDQEKAAKEIADKLNQFPELRDMFATMGALHAQQAEQNQQEGLVMVEPADVHGNPVGVPYFVEGSPVEAAAPYYPGDEDPDWNGENDRDEVEAREGE